MDDTAQSPQIHTRVSQGQAPSGQQVVPQPLVSPTPVESTTPQDVVNTQPVQSVVQQVQSQGVQTNVAVGGKEQETTVIAEVQASQPELVVPQEVQEAGVEATPSEEPQLTDEHKTVGLEAAKETTPVPLGPTKVQLPEDYEAPKGFFALFRQQVKNAATWLYLLVFKAEQQKAQGAQEKHV